MDLFDRALDVEFWSTEEAAELREAMLRCYRDQLIAEGLKLSTGGVEQAPESVHPRRIEKQCRELQRDVSQLADLAGNLLRWMVVQGGCSVEQVTAAVWEGEPTEAEEWDGT